MRILLLAGASTLALLTTSAQAVTFYGGETFTVTESGLYQIVAFGAQGGGGLSGSGGGLGAEVGGDLRLSAGTTLEVVVGGQGGSGDCCNGAGGGGGGMSAVATSTFAPLVVAGGGGGASWNGTGAAGYAAKPGERGTGFGGQGGGPTNGGGGGGWLSPGANSGAISTGSGYGGSGPPSFAGGAGAVSAGFSLYGPVFMEGPNGGGGGGGGGGGYNGGGGGGGYAGGSFGGGGGSYLATGVSPVVNQSGVQFGDGLVTISFVPEPASWSLMITGLGFLGYVLRRRITGRLRRA
jgi:hypothetical protein